MNMMVKKLIIGSLFLGTALVMVGGSVNNVSARRWHPRIQRTRQVKNRYQIGRIHRLGHRARRMRQIQRLYQMTHQIRRYRRNPRRQGRVVMTRSLRYRQRSYYGSAYSASPRKVARRKLSYQRDLVQLKTRTLHDLNRDRARHGLAPLRETPRMMKLAQKRAKQTMQLGKLVHYNPKGQMYETIDAHQLGTHLGNRWGENLAEAGLGRIKMTGDPVEYNNRNGIDMANMDEEAMFDYDQKSGWGHRNNILDNYNVVGIGVTHQARKGQNGFLLAEEFGHIALKH